MSEKIHAIILTLNEEKHIARCINSLRNECSSITVIDSGSLDRTTFIAQQLGARVIFKQWINYSTQLNFGIDSIPHRNGWLLRMDADEVLDSDSCQTLAEAVATVPQDTVGLLVQRRIYFFGRRIRHGGLEPSWQLRIWRIGSGRCENRWMDEHINVKGQVAKSGVIVSDINLNSLTWWTDKHNAYASREAIDILQQRYAFLSPYDQHFGDAGRQARLRRFMKVHFYSKIPIGMRSFLYFLYRYVLRLGFLDGLEGYFFHLLQGLWYRTLIDAKIVDIERYSSLMGVSINEAIVARTGIDPLFSRISMPSDEDQNEK